VDAVTSPPPVHRFDESRASEFVPRTDHVKTAILVEVADADAITVLETGFGEQTMRGAFYAIADGEGSYGAAKAEFERSHERVTPTTWRKSSPVLAYRADASCRVDTDVGETREASVVARPGDWIVRQHTGEVMVIRPEAFDERYRPRS